MRFLMVDELTRRSRLQRPSMKLSILTHLAAAALLGTVANADEETFTQVGRWSCSIPSTRPPAEVPCPTVGFPKAFGGPPQIIFSDTQAPAGIEIAFGNPTAEGVGVSARSKGATGGGHYNKGGYAAGN